MFILLNRKFALGTLLLFMLVAMFGFGQTSFAQNRDNFHDGVREGQSGGRYSQNSRHSYNPNGYDQHGYDRDGYNQNGYNPGGYNRNGRSVRESDNGGIGPGKGALIGGAGGAVLGALFGGGLKGTIIGGAAGAGIGAMVGNQHQSEERRRR